MIYDFSLQLYNAADENLFTVNQINTFFTTSSCIEFFVYDLSQNILYDSYNFNNYQVLNSGDINDSLQLSQFVLNPESNVNGLGYSQGEYVAYYNFLNNVLQRLHICIRPDGLWQNVHNDRARELDE